MGVQGSIKRQYKKGRIICLQGEPGDCLFIMKKGAVGVFINPDIATPSAQQVRDKGKQIAVIETPGEIIGEGGIFHTKRSATLIALNDHTELEHIPIVYGSLAKVMSTRSGFALNLCRCLASRLRDLNERVQTVATLSAAIQQQYNTFAINYLGLVEKLEHLQTPSRDLRGVADTFKENMLYLHGQSIQDNRRQTQHFMKDAEGRNSSTELVLNAGDLLCDEGRLGRALYLVRSGELEVTLGKLVVGSIGPDEIVGEIAVLLKETPKRTATVRAIRKSRLLKVSTVKFYEIVEEQPSFLIPIAKNLSSRLDLTNRYLCSEAEAQSEMAAVLAGKPGSCEAEFLEMQKILRRYPEARRIADSAEIQARSARRCLESMIRRIQQDEN